MLKICAKCGVLFSKRTKYCCASCYHAVPVSNETRLKMSISGKGKAKPPGFGEKVSASLKKVLKTTPRPWMMGANNPNFGNKVQSRPEVRERFLKAVKIRGQAWSVENREAHRIRMLGPSNFMRGKKHSQLSIKKMSETQKERFKNGSVQFRSFRSSKAETEIASFLKQEGYDFIQQFHIQGQPYIYDFYLPAKNLIIEYNGDYWHANPHKYPEGTLLKIQNIGLKLVEDIWKRDKLKVAAASQNGFNIQTVWEEDYKKLGMETIKCLVSK